MERTPAQNAGSYLVVVDAGHGGWDNGASFEGRLEKDDNLRLALATERALAARGVRVLMTRSTDQYISLPDRAEMANAAGADLFIALHRNSYTEQTPLTNGVENFIYLTAPEEPTGRAAQLVLDEVVAAGVQRDIGVKRGDYYVLRRTAMPAMLLEMGYIINEEDNRLFDRNLDAYAEAIARGAVRYLQGDTPGADGLPAPMPMLTSQPVPQPAPGGTLPPRCAGIGCAQAQLNDSFGAGVAVTGVYDAATRRAAVAALQAALNNTYSAGLQVDGVWGPQTAAMVRSVKRGDSGDLAYLVQLLLLLNGYDPGVQDGVYGAATERAVEMFQRDHYLVPDGVAGVATLRGMLGV